MEHPIVGDYQLLTLPLMVSLLANPDWGWTLLLYMCAAAIDALFWSLIFAPVLYILLPIMAIYLESDVETRMSMDSDPIWRIFKRWTDATTIGIWLPAVLFGENLIDDENLPWLIALQWMALPFNNFLGFFTILPFLPVTAYAIFATR